MKKTLISLAAALLIIPISLMFGDFSISEFQADTLWHVMRIYIAVSLGCFILSQAVANYSQVDKLWSIIPVVFVWVIAYEGGFEPRLLLMAILVSIWGIRLTYNFSRRGGYSWRFWEGEEDYRWAVLRKNPLLNTKWKWTLFNFGFISFYQLGLLTLITLPMITSISESSAPLGMADVGIALLFLGFVVFETVADQQQWIFQNTKHVLRKTGALMPEVYEKGFIAEGLWRISRHPNYFAEQSIWVTFYLFSVSATGNWINWSIVGCLLLITLFQGSANFSEGITMAKYPKYRQYQQRTSKFIPAIGHVWAFSKATLNKAFH